jgi:hypothetical protein
LDAQQRVLLWRIYQGEERFPAPKHQDRPSCRDYDYLVETLISLRKRGYIEGLLEQKNTGIDGCRYLSALITGGLTHEGYKVARALAPAPAAGPLADLLTGEGLHQCQRDFERALGSVATDPEQAIGSASSMLESICKAILERHGAELPANQSIQPLVKATLDRLDLAPGSEGESDIRSALKGLGAIAQSVGSLRTNSGAAHGRGPAHQPLQPRHARLAVNAAATVGLFLLETALEQTE